MPDLEPLLALLVHWRALTAIFASTSLAILVAYAVPTMTVEFVLGGFFAGTLLGITWEVRAQTPLPTSAQPSDESHSSRAIALLGFALIGGFAGFLHPSSLGANVLAIGLLAAAPFVVAPAVNPRGASHPSPKLLAAASAASCTGFCIGFGLAALTQ